MWQHPRPRREFDICPTPKERLRQQRRDNRKHPNETESSAEDRLRQIEDQAAVERLLDERPADCLFEEEK